MKSYILHIGVVDKENHIHAVSFNSGVNVITGKSSTGKSALIEIFDYCFGSSDFTVPEGIITKYADIYFIVMKVKSTNLIIGRRGDENKAFVKEEFDNELVKDKNSFKSNYFDKDYFYSLDDFKKELRRYFDLEITDIDENLDGRIYKGKSPTPSVRSFTSFMLQHQNLIANKHAIFYRFDEKEKREQAIDHFKVFAGFADQQYFINKQELHELEKREKHLALQLPKKAEIKKQAILELKDALIDYHVNSGKQLDIGNIEDVIRTPRLAYDKIRSHEIEIIADSNAHAEIKHAAEQRKRKITADLRIAQQKLMDIRSSIKFASNYKQDAGQIPVPESAEVHVSKCPFCNVHHYNIENHANKLTDAIDWLNNELNQSQYMLESFREDERNAESRIEELKNQVQLETTKIENIESQINELATYKTQYELALKAKIKVETLLEKLLEKPEEEINSEIVKLRKDIAKIKNSLKEYNIEEKLTKAETAINTYMKTISKQLEFEESYKPINLEFSLSTFDLWNNAKDRKVFLRSMGSGANWLSCHVALFLALHRYFCELGDNCKVPSILFFDQPSQVYFPSILDNSDEFSAKEIAQKEVDAGSKRRTVDEDITAVTNLYVEFVRYCRETLEKTGIEPQIIITDHADKLDIDGDNTTTHFEELVKGRRWRTQGSGFIDLSKTDDAANKE